MTEQQSMLAAENVPLAIFLANKYGKEKKYVDRDDTGLALEGLCKAAIRYQPGSVPFSAYAARGILMELAKVDYVQSRKKYAGEHQKDSLDREIGRDGCVLTLGEVVASVENMENEIVTKLLYEQLFKALNEGERRIVEALMDGYRQAEIAREIGISSSAVWRKIKAIREKTKGVMSHDEAPY